MIDVLHISCSIPIDDYGSFGVFRRHYRALDAKEFRVRPVASPAFLANIPASEFPARIPLPTRAPWWPPVRPFGQISPTFYRWRFRLLARRLAQHIDREHPNVIVTHLWDYYSFFAAYYAHLRGLPLITFLHDNLLDWAPGKSEHRHVSYWTRFALAHSFHIFAVSPELLTELPGTKNSSCSVLPPVPSPAAPAHRALRLSGSGVVYAFAGKRFQGVELVLKDLAQQFALRGDRLFIVGEIDGFARSLASTYPKVITLQEKFPTSEVAMNFLGENADVLLVAYPAHAEVNGTAWSSLRTSFPSRLVEYAQLRRPILVFCPRESALGEWCVRRGCPTAYHETDTTALDQIVAALDTPDALARAASFWSTIADTEFSPEKIQSEFTAILRSAAAQTRP